jgi:hypothetical protein
VALANLALKGDKEAIDILKSIPMRVDSTKFWEEFWRMTKRQEEHEGKY